MDNQELWQAILGEMELLISRASFTAWFKQTSIVSYEKDNVIIGVPNAYTKNWFEKKYHSKISEVLKNITDNQNIKISYQIISDRKKEIEKKNKTKVQTEDNQNQTIFYNKTLNPKYTFDNYIIGKGNELAQAAAKAIVKKPGEAYNPLFIYGGVGLGKTHLMQAVGNAILKKFPNKKILYVPCEKFINDFVNALSSNQTENFKQRYREIDVLLVDDIQFLSGKEQTQEAFFHTFNELHQTNKQIILTSDRPPKSISTLEDRLISRFEWGMIADVSAPDLETRSAILRYKAKEKNFKINNEVIDFLATNIKNNVRELEGALNKVIAFHEFNNTEPTIDSVKNILTNLNKLPNKQNINIKKIIETVAEFYNISKKDLLGSSRKKNLAIPRQIAMYLARNEIKLSYPSIGNEFGKKDHTTVMHAFSKIQKKID